MKHLATLPPSLAAKPMPLAVITGTYQQIVVESEWVPQCSIKMGTLSHRFRTSTSRSVMSTKRSVMLFQTQEASTNSTTAQTNSANTALQTTFQLSGRASRPTTTDSSYTK